jgi:hypothetical protein
VNFTNNNHLYYEIGGRKFGYRENAEEQYKVFCGQADPDVYRRSSWYNELLKTADTVLNEYGDDLVVFLSGGTDSEIVLRNFLRIGHTPRCATIKFKDDYNAPDVIEAENIAKELGVELEVIDFDVKDFYWSGEAASFAKEIDCTQVTYLMVYYHIKKLGFPAVMGGEQLLKRHVNHDGSFWYHCFRENEDGSAMRFSNKFKIPLVNEWFSYTPEMMLYYLEDPDIYNLVTNRYNYKLTSVSSKNRILRRLYPSIRPKAKTHGFERLLGFNQESYNSLRREVINRKESSLDGIPIEQLLTHLKAKL